MPDMDSVWSDEDYNRALTHLDALQKQLNDICISIPKTIAVLPMLTSPSDPFVQSPNAVFKGFATSAVNAAQQVKDIQENWRSQATAGILEKVRDSVARDGDIQVQNLAHKRVKSPFDIKVERTSFQDEAHNATQGSDNALGSMKEEEDRIVAAVQSTYRHLPDFEITRAAQRDLLKVTVPIQGVLESLRFTCRRVVQGPDDWWYRAMCIFGPSKPGEREAITRCLEARTNPRDLASTLHMLAAYHSNPTAACAGCKRKFEPGTGFRLTGRGRSSTTDDPTYGWKPYHESCLI